MFFADIEAHDCFSAKQGSDSNKNLTSLSKKGKGNYFQTDSCIATLYDI
jgi:hypothetical protein